MGLLKQKMVSAMGGIGAVLYYILLLAVGVFPLVILKTSFIWDVVIIAATQLFPPLSIVVWIWAFVVAVSTPITTVSIIFFILFTIIALPFFISIICDLFGR